MYARQIDGETLTLAASGQLWKGSMVLYDQETWTRWPLLSGEGQLGKYQGRRLEALPSVLTNWARWRAQYPEGTVALPAGGGPTFRRDVYHDPGRFVLGIASNGTAKTWGFDRLVDDPALNDEWAGEPVAVVLEPTTMTARLFKRTVGERVLTFRRTDGQLTDTETGSTWEPISGRATSGPLAGSCLIPLPATVAYREAWLRFYPRSE